MAQGVTQQLGGRLALVESRPGEGSTFRVEIPAESTPPVQPRAPTPPLRVGSGTAPLAGYRVLLAEDTEDLADSLCEVLTVLGAETTHVSDGASAVERGTHELFDVVLMDIGLPEMDGLSATRELRRRGCPSTIVALTAYATFSDREQCLSAGCDEFLPKPVDIEALVAAIGRARLSA